MQSGRTYLIDPDGNVTQHLTVFRQIKVSQRLLVLFRRVLLLESLHRRKSSVSRRYPRNKSVKFARILKVSNEAYFFATVLFQVMQQSAGVDEPQNGGVEIFVSLFNEPANSVDSGCQERLDLLVVVDVISVADAHEDNVGRKSR
jgi:hypothetical protein